MNYRTCLKILLLMSLTVFATAAKLMAENSAKNGSFRTITVAISKPADFTTIKEAVNDANDGDCVVVADGTYGDYWNSEVDFKGKAITLRSEHGPKHCIINCQNRQRAFVFQSGEDSNSVVSGFTIMNGYARKFGNSTQNKGGAIYCEYAGPHIVNCRIVGNHAVDKGGGVYIGYESSPEFIRCLFRDNSAETGGAVHCARESNTTFKSCVFFDNVAGHSGAGLYVHVASATLLNCTFTRNRATYIGSAISSAVDAEVILKNCILWNANSADGHKAIACVHRTNLYVDYCTVLGGQANIFNTAATVNWGTGNSTANPHLTNDNFSLLVSSPCINAGDPAFLAGPDDVDIHGQKRVMLGRVDMGADEYNPFKAELVVLGRDRIRRTVFEYECEVLLRNISRFAVSNVSFQMTARSENITIIDPNISFGDVEVASGGTATSIDTCTFRVDRSEAINPAEIIWNSTAKIAKTGNKIEHTVSTPLPPETADFDGLNLIADKWLWQGTAGGIGLDTVQDGTVNLADFAIFADQWGIK